MNVDFCVGFLDNRDRVALPVLGNKMKDLTELHVTRLYQAYPSYTSDDINSLFEWFKFHTRNRYLLVIKYGTLLNSRDLVVRSIKQLTEMNAVVKGRIKMVDGHIYLTDSILLIDRHGYPDGFPQWGEANVEADLNEARYDEVNTVVSRSSPRKTVTKSEGWGLAAHSLQGGKTIVDFDLTDYSMIYDLNPECGTTELYNAFASFHQLGVFLKTFSQHVYLLKHHFSSKEDGIATLFDESEQQGVRGNLTNIRNLVCRAKGLHPLMILKTVGFTPNTRVHYLDFSGLNISLRKVMVDNWDGINLPKFVHDYECHKGAKLVPKTLDTVSAWERILKTFGGPREFKMLWDAYRKLDHSYRVLDISLMPNAAISNIPMGPSTYVWLDDMFCRESLHSYLSVDSRVLSESFNVFVSELEPHKNGIVLDVRDWSGRWF